ncbi:MAG TPA: isochorismatase family protein [Candidatus Binatia bacterium]|nr:isochorismatase family protein [Candidatus Binatia bacterium]
MDQKIEIGERDALLHVDVQATFMPGGGLAVADGDKILPAVLALQAHFDTRGQIYCTLDQHPYGHISLASSYVGLAPYAQLDLKAIAGWTSKKNGIAKDALFDLRDLTRYLREVGSQTLWPDHGIAGSVEADMHPALWNAAHGHFDFVLIKGYDAKVDSYSGFRDNLKQTTGLGATMRENGVERIFVDGLAFDFCVGWSAIDAAAEGFEVYLIEEATRSVNLPGTVDRMRADLAAAGVKLVTAADVIG